MDMGNGEQYPFHFGVSKDQACARLMRVKELWSLVEERCQQPPEPQPDNMGVVWPRQQPKEPAWDAESLWLARELAAGRVQILVGRSLHELPVAYGIRIQELARKYPTLHFVPEDQQAFSEGTDFGNRAIQFRLDEIRHSAPNVLPEVPRRYTQPSMRTLLTSRKPTKSRHRKVRV